MKNKIKVLKYSKDINKLFDTNSSAYVHSIFKRSLNINIQDRLIHLGVEENGVSPFSICISSTDIDEFVDKLEIGEELSTTIFDFENSGFYDPIIRPTAFHLENVTRSFNIIKSIIGINPNWKIGIDDFIDIRESDFPRSIVGKGLGLTPSGDDVLVGLLAILISMDKEKDLIKKINCFILNEAKDRTTDISYEYLYYASKGKFSKDVKIMCESILIGDKQQVIESVYRLIEVGHTSGFDTLNGILLGIN